jgi:hypothetical protein
MSYAYITVAGLRKESAQMLRRGTLAMTDRLLSLHAVERGVRSHHGRLTVNTQKSIHYIALDFSTCAIPYRNVKRYTEEEKCS